MTRLPRPSHVLSVTRALLAMTLVLSCASGGVRAAPSVPRLFFARPRVLSCEYGRVLAAPARQSRPDITSLVVFGDSYQDSGRILDISAAAVTAKIPGARIEPAARDASTYWRGRWSNGPTMVEVLAQ